MGPSYWEKEVKRYCSFVCNDKIVSPFTFEERLKELKKVIRQYDDCIKRTKNVL
jgi:hypothetical protein